jgi:8-oxo-dGTP diphosphatase / 2-hydroxy-dATP diphosphatase
MELEFKTVFGKNIFNIILLTLRYLLFISYSTNKIFSHKFLTRMLFETNKEKKLYTVIFIFKEDKILLGMKKRGFGEGKWNGFGGKVEKNETILQGAQRELEEEAGILCSDLKHSGNLYFEFESGFDKLMEVHIFSGTTFEGNIKETEEMKPQWFAIKDIPYHLMWKDDEIWFDNLLKKKHFTAHFKFKDYETINEYKMVEN